MSTDLSVLETEDSCKSMAPCSLQCVPNINIHWLIFTFMWPCIVTNFFIINPTKHINFPNLFCQETLHVSGSYSAHHQEFFTVHSALVYVMQVLWQVSSRTRIELQFHSGPARKLSSNLHDKYQCRMYSEKLLMMGRGTARNIQSFLTK
jgi:hypothetical protein